MHKSCKVKNNCRPLKPLSKSKKSRFTQRHYFDYFKQILASNLGNKSLDDSSKLL